MIFEKVAGSPQKFRFFIVYFVFDPGPGPKAVFYISHGDKQKIMRGAGLIV